ncbi:MAG TPA: site-specific integrase [Solirubrobacteraceae bacterium]|nr:site-specific integrase [Solirubrobacteraceae bacterium]
MTATTSRYGTHRQRSRVERGIYKRITRSGESRYEVMFYDSDRRPRWRTTDTLTEARLLRAELVTRIASGERLTVSKVTLEEFAEEWLTQQQPRLRSSTHRLYGAYLRQHIYPRLGNRQLSTISVDDIAHLIADMEAGWRYRQRDDRLVRVQGKPFAGWTIRGVLVAVSRVLGHATRRGHIHANPVQRLEKDERPTATRRELPNLDREAIGRLIASTPDRYRTLIALSVLTGIRQGEALGLTWHDIDLKEGLIRVRHQLDRNGNLVQPKTNAAKRDIPIPPSLTRLLATHKQTAFANGHAKATDYVFATNTGHHLDHRNITRRGLNKALTTARLPHLRWHDLRHLAASALISQGASIAYLSRILGHANPAITLSIYAHQYAQAEHAEHTRQQMEQAFGQLLT